MATGDDDQAPSNVTYLPAVRGDALPEPVEAVDAELVTDEDYARIQRERRDARYSGYVNDAKVVATVARNVMTHQRTKTVFAHSIVYPIAGATVVVKRWRDAHGVGRFERQMNKAEQDGDQERLRYWQAAKAEDQQRRHQQAMDRAKLPWRRVKTAVAWLIGVGGLLLLLGIILAASSGEFSDVFAPIGAVLTAVAFVVWFLTAYGLYLLVTAVCGGVYYLWRLGRRTVPTPAWLETPTRRGESFAILTEALITRALAHCKVAEFNNALKRGEPVEYIVTPREQGGGTYAQIRLQLGVIAADFLKPVTIERLAGNLGRHKHEVYPQRQPKADARVLDVWIADQGTMDRPAKEWPLLDEGEVDVFRDRLPVGVTMRGEQVEQGMLARHMLVGATSKQGKTATARLYALGLALDPTVELRISDLKGDGDWSMFAPRAHTLIEGSGIEQCEDTCAMLEDLVAEMQRRYDAKRAQGIKGNITRELSRQPNSGFHPIFAIVDEVQELYAAPGDIGGTKDDARAWRAAKRLHDQGRAVHIQLWQATQRPTDRTLPVLVREGAHVRISLYVPNYATAKMVVADAADMGARPQDLRPGRDAGTIVATGEFDDIPEGMAFLIAKSHYVSTQDAYGVIARAMEILERHGRTPRAALPAAARDPLVDMAAVLGDHPRLTTRAMLHGLVELDRRFYGEWTFQTLHEQFRFKDPDYEITLGKSNGQTVLRPDDIAAAITERGDRAGSSE